MTDPDLNAWYDTPRLRERRQVRLDLRHHLDGANGAKANMKLGARDFLIQQNWVNAGGGYCAMSY